LFLGSVMSGQKDSVVAHACKLRTHFHWGQIRASHVAARASKARLSLAPSLNVCRAAPIVTVSTVRGAFDILARTGWDGTDWSLRSIYYRLRASSAVHRRAAQFPPLAGIIRMRQAEENGRALRAEAKNGSERILGPAPKNDTSTAQGPPLFIWPDGSLPHGSAPPSYRKKGACWLLAPKTRLPGHARVRGLAGTLTWYLAPVCARKRGKRGRGAPSAEQTSSAQHSG